jgi:hypothetical protein
VPELIRFSEPFLVWKRRSAIRLGLAGGGPLEEISISHCHITITTSRASLFVSLDDFLAAL